MQRGTIIDGGAGISSDKFLVQCSVTPPRTLRTEGEAPLVKPPKTPDAPGGPDKKLPEAEGRQPISESRQLLKKAVQVLEEAEKHKER